MAVTNMRCGLEGSLFPSRSSKYPPSPASWKTGLPPRLEHRARSPRLGQAAEDVRGVAGFETMMTFDNHFIKMTRIIFDYDDDDYSNDFDI